MMGFIFRGTGTVASLATILLVALDIMQKHLGVDTQALLAGFGGGAGDIVAGFSGSFSDLVTWFANMLADAAPAQQPAEMVAERSADTLSATKSMMKQANNFEYAAQAVIGVVALAIGFFALRRG